MEILNTRGGGMAIYGGVIAEFECLFLQKYKATVFLIPSRCSMRESFGRTRSLALKPSTTVKRLQRMPNVLFAAPQIKSNSECVTEILAKMS